MSVAADDGGDEAAGELEGRAGLLASGEDGGSRAISVLSLCSDAPLSPLARASTAAGAAAGAGWGSNQKQRSRRSEAQLG